MEEKKLTDAAEIDVGMIERSVELDDTAYVWLLKGSMWKTYKLKEILALIHRLQDENEQLKSTKHRASWKAKFFKAQAEIERLKEEKTKEVFGLLDQYEKAEADVHSMEREADGYRKTIAELQKQADDHKRGLSVQRAYWEKQVQQAVKDTAKEICLKIIKGQPQLINEKWVEWFKKEYVVEVE